MRKSWSFCLMMFFWLTFIWSYCPIKNSLLRHFLFSCCSDFYPDMERKEVTAFWLEGRMTCISNALRSLFSSFCDHSHGETPKCQYSSLTFLQSSNPMCINIYCTFQFSIIVFQILKKRQKTIVFFFLKIINFNSYLLNFEKLKESVETSKLILWGKSEGPRSSGMFPFFLTFLSVTASGLMCWKIP